MNVYSYPVRLYHKTKKESQLVKSEADHKKLHESSLWVLEDQTSYYKKYEPETEPKFKESVFESEEFLKDIPRKGKK